MGNTPDKGISTHGEMFSPLVLVAEDNALTRRLTCDILKSKGYKVLEVANSRMIVEATRQNHPDLVLVDMTVPESNGINIVKKLREDKELDEIPVVAVINTVFDEEDTDFICQEYDQLVKKPVSIRLLAGMIDDILAKIHKYAER